MAKARSARDRDLIARSATLLGAELPLHVLVQRLCEAISASFGAPAYVVPRGGGPAVPPGQAQTVANVIAQGRASLTPSALFVPIPGGEETVGALGVVRDHGEPFSVDDQRLLEAIARYLGIAVLNQHTFRLYALASQHPWLPILLAIVLAIGASAAVFVYARAQMAEIRGAADSLQEGRLRQSALILNDYLGDSVHLGRAIAKVVGPMRSDALIGPTLSRFASSIDDPAIYGLGIFLEPYELDPHARLYGPYVERKGESGAFTFQPSDQVYDYLDMPWYKLGRASSADVIFTHPYREEGLTYLSAVLPVRDRGRFVGVVTVDSLPKEVIKLVGAALISGDTAYVTDDKGAIVLRTGAVQPPSSDRPAMSKELRWVRWTLHLQTDMALVNMREQRIATATALVIAVVWIVAVLAIAQLVRMRRAHLKAIRLQFRQADLENEIASSLAIAEGWRESAYHDALTGLPNRAFFLETLEERLDEAGASGAFTVFFIDIDRFSVVNDSLGHGAGDVLLQQIAMRMRQALPPETIIARLGGDEFVALLDSATEEAAAVEHAKALLARMREPFQLAEKEVFSGASIGIVVNVDGNISPESVLRDADIAMYQAKRTGRGRFAIFREEMHQRATALLEKEGDLRRALAYNAVRPYFQPIVDLRSGRMVSMEALARWERADGSIATAGDFIEFAEQSGALASIDAIVLPSACRIAHHLMASTGIPLHVSVNVSATSLTRTDIVADVLAALRSSGLPPESLKLEITETAIMDNADEALRVLTKLRSLNLGILVDDFGTGYSSLSYLRRLPISGLKIDRSFVAPIATDAQALAIVNAVVALAKTLALEVTAEGVETDAQLALLLSAGVDYAQGYYFSKAIPPEDLPAYIERNVEAWTPQINVKRGL